MSRHKNVGKFELCNAPAFAASTRLIDTASVHVLLSSSTSVFHDALNMNEDSVEGGRAGKVPMLLLKTKSTPHDGYEEYFSVVKGKDEKLCL